MKKRLLRSISLIITLLIMASSFSVVSVFNVAANTVSLPDFVDNSQSPYFPAIGNQSDLGSCVSWGQTYYQFTYMMNRSMGVPTTAENTFSPSFNFNIINGGRGTGAWDKDGYNAMKEIGSVPLSTVPYNTKEWNNWFAQEDVWKEAMQYRIKDYTYLKDIGMENSSITSADDSDLIPIKTLLAQGEVLAITTPIYSWDVEYIKAHPDVKENDKYVDEYVVRLCDKSGQGHRLALVGYNDKIWTDVNDNGKVDSGEMGAFKVANSWGTERHNKGFMWIAYDALNMTSCVKDCPVSGNYRPEAFYDLVSIEVIPYDTDADIYLRYTLNTADRSQGKVYATATKDGKEYVYEVGPKRQHGMTFNKYSYDGTTNANDGTMLFALSNIVPDITPETLHEYTWSFKFEDTSADGKAFTVKNFEIIDESTDRVIKPEGIYPFTLDGSTKTVVFPEIPSYMPPTTTAPTTTVAETTTTAIVTTKETVTTEPVEVTTTTGAPTATESQPLTTTSSTVPSSTFTDPIETTTEYVPVTTTVPEVITTSAITSTSPVVTSTEATTTKATEITTIPVTTTVPFEIEEHIYGDTNNSNNISISDASLIQKYLAFLISEGKLNLANADCNSDNKVSVKDATCIQKYLAKISGFGVVGEKYEVKIPVTNTTDSTEATVTTAPATTDFTSANTSNIESTVFEDPTEASTTAKATEVTDPTEVTTEPISTTEAEVTTQAPTSLSTTAIATNTTEIITTTALVTEATTEAPSEVVTEPITTEPVTTEPSTTEVVDPVNENVVTFTNSFGWRGTISCYYWSDSNKNMTAWPGVAMNNAGTNSYGETLYTLQIPKDAAYVIFSNGSTQTVDIPYSGGEQKFYPVAPNGEGKYTVENW